MKQLNWPRLPRPLWSRTVARRLRRFTQSLGYGVTRALAGGPGKFGAEFTVPGAGAAGADVALEHILINGSNGVVDASFWTDGGGLPGTTQIGGSFAVTAPAGFPRQWSPSAALLGLHSWAGKATFGSRAERRL